MAGMNYLSMLQGTGNAGVYSDDVTGVLVELVPREGSYSFELNGRTVTRPNSWTARFADGQLFSWPTYVDQATGQVMPWSRFDSSINLVACAQQGVAIHVWRDERKRMHLELAAQNASVTAMAGGLPWNG